jgi:glycosyltransferase involved in cell wall biosynthesis
MTSLRVVYIEPLITPYRVPLFNLLGRRFEDFEVIFLGQPGPRWKTTLNETAFRYSVAEGRQWQMPGRGWLVEDPRPLWRALANKRPGLIILAGYSTLAFLTALLYARSNGVPTIMFSASHPGTVKERGGIADFYRRWFVRQVNAFAVPSNLARDLLLNLGAPSEKIFKTPNAIDNQLFSHRSAEVQLRAESLKQELGVSGKRLILFVGRLVREKRVDLLIEAFALAKKRGVCHVSLLLAGDGPLKNDLERQVRDLGLEDVVFAGFTEQERLVEYYGISDALVLYSERETWGMVVNEAMACNLPVIISDACGAAGDAVVDGVNGYVVPAHQAAQLSDAILRLFSDDARRQEMAEASQRLVQQYTLDAAVEGFWSAAQAIRVK